MEIGLASLKHSICTGQPGTNTHKTYIVVYPLKYLVVQEMHGPLPFSKYFHVFIGFFYESLNELRFKQEEFNRQICTYDKTHCSS